MPQQAVKPKFTCEACGERYTWKPRIAGRQAKCKCGAVITVPETNPLDRHEVEPEAEAPQFDDYDVEQLEEAAAEPPPPLPPPPVPSRGVKPKLPSTSAGDAKAGASGGLVGVVNSFIPDNDNWKWWYYIVGGVLMLPCAFYQYFRLLDYEKGEESRLRLKSFERVLYGIFGKWGVCGFLVFIGAVCIFIGYAKFMNRKQGA